MKRTMKVPVRRPRDWDYDFDTVSEGNPVSVVPEPTNKVDPNALMIRDPEGKTMGYVPAELAKQMAPMLKDEVIKLLGAKVLEVDREGSWTTVSVEITFDDGED